MGVNITKNILIYLQDVGGTNYLLPLLKVLNDGTNVELNTIYVVHPLSISTIKNILAVSTNIESERYPISESRWSSILNNSKIDYVLSTLSANNYDNSNANLISQAKKENIPTIGFMDHWKGFERVLDEEGNQKYCPNWLGIIDNFSATKLKQYGINEPVVQVVGNPVLEASRIRVQKYARGKERKKVLIVSQPEIDNGSYDSVFSIKNNNVRLIDSLSDSLLKSDQNLKIFYRPHPKENSIGKLPDGILIDDSNKEDLFQNYDIFVGLNSMLLFEAYLSGCYTVSLKLPIFKEIFQDNIPYSFALEVSSMEEVSTIFNRGVFNFSGVSREIFSNSSEQCFAFINNFLDRHYA
jgi:hypothetical protein